MSFSGLVCAIGGMALTMTTGIGAPLAGAYYTLSSVAAVVIGGVSLAGGRGGMVGPVHGGVRADAERRWTWCSSASTRISARSSRAR